ncbi:unnamed protein product [Schistosoma curassoni]|uniref:Uncharacterized protein n=1 Tax=Schistosoma curassoni TaxID=6186 RepID=A0A183JPR2_9TREM|nr:unnamed protein product [Schistosoma curassoni]
MFYLLPASFPNFLFRWNPVCSLPQYAIANSIRSTDIEYLTSRKHGTVVTGSTQNFISCDVTTNPHTASWRDSESVHRFWKPIDPDEYNRPKEYLDSAVSWFSTNDTQCCPPNIHSESANTLEFTENEIKDTDFTGIFLD